MSEGEEEVTSIPPPALFSIIKEPYNAPLILSTAFTTSLSGLMKKSTINVVLTVTNPPPATTELLPIVSFILSPLKLNLPESEENTAEDISGSFGS